jgi:hypothetical protein
MHMSIENIEMIAHHEIVTRWRSRVDALALFVAIGIVIAALISAV